LLRDQQSAARQMPAREMQQKKPSQSRSNQTKDPYHASYRDDSSDDDTGYSYRDSRGQSGKTDGNGPQFGSLFGNKGGADALLASANELGTNMWKQANTWFSMGKKKIIEMQETVMEQRRPGSGASSRQWRDEDYLPSQQPYRDSSSDDDGEMYVSAYRRGNQQKQQPQQRTDGKALHGSGMSTERRGGPSSSGGQRQEKSFIDINDGPAGSFGFEQTRSQHAPAMHSRSQYDSASHSSASATQAPRTAAASVSASSSSASTPPPAAIPALAAHVLQSAHAAKTRANEQFKLGQFGDAIAGYTQSISHVVQSSDAHPILIVLYNNRALAYARNGESKSALGDCALALDLCQRYQGNQTVDLGSGAGKVDVGDQRAKALQRRGEAYEAGEKYSEALADWKVLREIARDSGMRQQATRGIQRCEKMLGINQPAKGVAKKPAAEQRPEDIANLFASISMHSVKNKATALDRHMESSAAVAEMRRKEEAKRVEDDQRLAILDQVDAEIRRWRDGKQQNLRALLSSLHTLLPEFPPIGMHEILEPNKVKRAYMRAIARLHPDKLSKDIDVRTKMVSSNVFSSLNEAWDTFKAQEGVN
ncbi:auxilin-like clathrin-binding protein required for normal clathrin function, partial [Coemansia sp. RSA 2599]